MAEPKDKPGEEIKEDDPVQVTDSNDGDELSEADLEQVSGGTDGGSTWGGG
jgi:hypothetical protein